VDLEQAIGQYLLYKSWLRRLEPERTLYLAVSQATARTVFRDVSAHAPMQDYGIRLLVVDIETERIVEWIE
jgi:hypothetical protein